MHIALAVQTLKSGPPLSNRNLMDIAISLALKYLEKTVAFSIVAENRLTLFSKDRILPPREVRKFVGVFLIVAIVGRHH